MTDISISSIKSRRWLIRAVALSAVAAMIHMLMAPVYFQQWIGYGVFFFAAASTEILYAMLLVVASPNRFLYWLGIVGNAACIALWLVSRTVGVPFFGPEAGVVQPVGAVDLITQFIQIVLIIHLLTLLRMFPNLDQRPLVE